MSKLVQLRQVFGELILSLRRAFDNLKANEGITLKGPTTVNQGETVSWEITDHDVFSRYDVEVDLGTASVSGNVITYRHEIGKPVHTPFLMSVSCNETRRDLMVGMVERGIMKPYLISVTSAFTGTGYTLTFNSGPFTVKPAGGDTHISTDWEIATDEAFTNVIWSKTKDTVNKVSVTTGELAAGTTIHVRLRYNGSSFPSSPWYVCKLIVNNQLNTTWVTSFETAFSAGPKSTVSYTTSWVTEKQTVEYGAQKSITENVTNYRTFVKGSWIDVPKLTEYLTDHVTSVIRNTAWVTGVSTARLSAIGYSAPVSRTTEYLTTEQQNTFRNTGTAYVNGSGKVVEDLKVTSWDTLIDRLTSHETSYNSVHSHDTSMITAYQTQHVTTDRTSWDTSHGTSHVTSYTTGSTRTTSMTTSWTSSVWSGIKVTYFVIDKYYQDRLYAFWADPRFTEVSWEFTQGESGPEARKSNYRELISQSLSRTTSWTTSDAQTTSHTTSYTTTYSTGQDTSWTTNYDTSHETSWVTDVRYTSKTTSNNTSGLTSK